MKNHVFKLVTSFFIIISLLAATGIATTTAAITHNNNNKTNFVFAQTSNDVSADTQPIFLAVQNAQHGHISKVNSSSFTLTLDNVSDSMILFSERPERIVTAVNTSDFIGNWTVGRNSFVVDAPNALVVLDNKHGKQDMGVIELFNPVYDTEKKTLKYTITLDDTTSMNLPSEFGQSTILIDSSGSYVAGFGFAVGAILKFKAHKDNPTG